MKKGVLIKYFDITPDIYDGIVANIENVKIYSNLTSDFLSQLNCIEDLH